MPEISTSTTLCIFMCVMVMLRLKLLLKLSGQLPPRVMGLVIEWAAQHQAELLADWELARQQKELKSITPLD